MVLPPVETSSYRVWSGPPRKAGSAWQKLDKPAHIGDSICSPPGRKSIRGGSLSHGIAVTALLRPSVLEVHEKTPKTLPTTTLLSRSNTAPHRQPATHASKPRPAPSVSASSPKAWLTLDSDHDDFFQRFIPQGRSATAQPCHIAHTSERRESTLQ